MAAPGPHCQTKMPKQEENQCSTSQLYWNVCFISLMSKPTVCELMQTESMTKILSLQVCWGTQTELNCQDASG